jgi:type I restriction enzyme S subunit
MNAERLLAHYERIADAPDAIPRLRRFILDLAVRGKLVPQDPNDSVIPDTRLRRNIDRKQPTGRTGADLGPVTFEEIPIELPVSWKWSRLFQLCVQDAPIVYGILQPGPDVRPQGVPYVRPSEIENGRIALSHIRHTTQEIAQQYSRASIKSGDLILTIVGTIGSVAVVPPELDGGNITQSSCRLRVDSDLIDRSFLLYALRSGCVDDQINRMKLGTAVPRLNIAHVRAIAVPLPPLPEQHRIVAKVDELMALCDRLEAARVEREKTRDRLAAASLARLDAPNPETFRDDARFVLDALPTLTTRPNQIKQLRQTILNLAVRGKLVSQDSSDESASNVLDRISENRKRLYRQKKIPKPKPLPSIDNLGVPFSLPSKWAWSLLGQLCYQVSDGPHFSPQYVSPDEGIPFLSTRNVRPGAFDLRNVKYVSRSDHNEFCKRVRPERDDIIYTKGGTTGIAKVNDLDFEFSVWVHLAVLRIEKQLLYPRFIEMALNSPHCYEQSQIYTQGTSNFDLGLTRMVKITIPLPPLPEQRRIVAKVDELMNVCDRLEASLTAGDDTRTRLLDVLMADALESDQSDLEQAA